MRRRSPQRTRRIKRAAVIGAIVGLALGWVAYTVSGRFFFVPVMVVFATLIAAATTALSETEYDYD